MAFLQKKPKAETSSPERSAKVAALVAHFGGEGQSNGADSGATAAVIDPLSRLREQRIEDEEKNASVVAAVVEKKRNSRERELIEASLSASSTAVKNHRSSVTVRRASAVSQDALSESLPTTSRIRLADTLLGEKQQLKAHCWLSTAQDVRMDMEGELQLTNFRLRFCYSQEALPLEHMWMVDANMFEVTLGNIEEFEKTSGNSRFKHRVKVVSKDFRNLVFAMDTEADASRIIQHTCCQAHPLFVSKLFAFQHAELTWQAEAGKCMPVIGGTYDAQQDFGRMGVDMDKVRNVSSPYRQSKANNDYSLCISYPPVLVFPRSYNEPDLMSVANFRKRGRVPTLTWCGGTELGYASIWRCSQPMEGLKRNKCAEDEGLLRAIRQSTRGSRPLLVLDMRPVMSAYANKAGGGGFTDYEGCNLVFCGCENIHHVRSAWRAMGTAISNVEEGDVGSWWRDVADSKWLDHIGSLLKAAVIIATEVFDNKNSVLVHCSDGWDRTAQAVSIAELCLDSHYRSYAGFITLIQKEFCGFGHKFKTRLALGEKTTSEFCPIFVQWLDCVYQLVMQFPTEFGFNPAFLLQLAEDSMNCRYGSFLCDTDKERHDKVMPFTMCVWAHYSRPEVRENFDNPHFKPSSGCLIPRITQSRLKIWDAYWYRYHPSGYPHHVRRISDGRPDATKRGVVVPTSKKTVAAEEKAKKRSQSAGAKTAPTCSPLGSPRDD